MKQNDIIPFNFEGKGVRVVTRQGTPWWVLSDVCDVLEISHAPTAAKRLDEDEKSTVVINDSGNLNPERTIINESGLWSLVLTSRKAEAKRFKKWLTSEVIPSIRKDGGYISSQPNETPEQLYQRAMKALHSTVERQQAQIETMQSDVDVLARIAKADGSLCVTEAAKVLAIRPKDLFSFLSQNKWIYRRAGAKSWLGYSYRCNTGDLEHKVRSEIKADGSETIQEQVRITTRGLKRLAALCCGAGAEA